MKDFTPKPPVRRAGGWLTDEDGAPVRRPMRSLKVEDPLWEALEVRAHALGVSRSRLIRDTLWEMIGKASGR